MSSEQIKAIEQNIEQAKKVIDFAQSLERLMGNRDFKRIVLEGYFQQEAIRLVHLKSDPNMQKAEAQESITNQMIAIGSLNQYFGVIFQQANMARKSLESDEEARDEMLAEDLTNA